jgi:hypothetical protein
MNGDNSPATIAYCVSLQYFRVLSCNFGPVRLSYNPYFSACFFSQNSVSLTTNQRTVLSAMTFQQSERALYILQLGSIVKNLRSYGKNYGSYNLSQIYIIL